ncbi:MAG: 6-phosphofructokinase [Bacteroidales bacterium]|nr:6-phosphofructokinase [Bacteroidales bacterium]
MNQIRKIAVLTSGGDSPGMNAAIRAVARTGFYHNMDVYGVMRGYQGLIDDDMIKLDNQKVANIIQRGGTILKSERSKQFETKEGRRTAYENLKAHNIDAMVVIGGDGTFTGADVFCEEFDFQVVGIPGTIDNDLYGTDYALGYDTAINTVVEAVDKLRDTAGSHNRLFFVEVMGRDAGFIALRSGIATGAEDILIPETETCIDDLIEKLNHDRRENKTSGIIMVAEGDDAGNAYQVARKVNENFHGYETRVTVLGHVQRGGAPTCMDRVLASTLGYEAVNSLLKGKYGVMIGKVKNEIQYTPFKKAVKHHKVVNESMLEMARILSL